MTPPIVDRFTVALSEGLSRAGATTSFTRAPVRAVTRPARRAPAAPASPFTRDEAEATMRRFTAVMDGGPFAADGAEASRADADAARRAILALARYAMERVSGGSAPAVRPPSSWVDPAQLIEASLLLAECVTRSGSDATAALREVREVFAAAAGVGRASGARDEWRERRALARDFHGRVRSPLAAALRQLDGSGGQLDGSAGDRLLGEAKRMVAQAADEAEEIVSGLYRSTPVPDLRDELAAACARAAEQGIAVEWGMTGDETTLPELFRRELILVLREALLNACTHAAPRSVLVSVRVTRKWAHAQVRDDGGGFDVAQAVGSGHAHGLRSMSERMESVGGQLVIRSGADGTRVDMHLPRYQPK
ncbi:hypothetical protein P8605_47925 [Streptomyces sp. T-3]|nr:hypothetical protein [Streptomyces sp. T-3]